MTTWTQKQSERLSHLLDLQSENPDKVWIGYWNSDQLGRPANGGKYSMSVYPGMVQVLEGEIDPCRFGYHATREPHRWSGCKVWVIALLGDRIDEAGKSVSLTREIIGEILPEDCIDPRIGVRIGRKDLRGANLSRANLRGANLKGANLKGAHLIRANLSCAYGEPRSLPDGYEYKGGKIIRL